MKKKSVFYLPLLLTVLLLAGCEGLRPNSSTNTSETSEIQQEVDIFSDALPPLGDIETWPLPLSTNYVSKRNYEFEGEEENTTVAYSEHLEYQLNLFTNGFKGHATNEDEEEAFEAKIYVYHDDGITYAYDYGPEYDEENDDEMIHVGEWYEFEDEDLQFYTDLFEDTVLEMITELYSMFNSFYEILSEINDQSALDEFLLEMAEEMGEDATLSIRFYRQGNRYILKATYEYTEDGEEIVGEETAFIEIKDSLPAHLFLEVKETVDGYERLMSTETTFTYSDVLPAYNGPFMPAA